MVTFTKEILNGKLLFFLQCSPLSLNIIFQKDFLGIHPLHEKCPDMEFSVLYFPVFREEKTPYLDGFHAVVLCAVEGKALR